MMINLTFTYKAGSMTLPINPEELKIPAQNDNKTANIVSLGEVVIPGDVQLRNFTIASFFWAAADTVSPTERLAFFQQWAASKLPARFVAETLGIDVQVVVSSFEFQVLAGEEEDRYYTLALTEYRPYGAKVVQLKPAAPPAGSNTGTSTVSRQPAIGELKNGMIVDFLGGSHYRESNAAAPVGGNRTAGKATVTRIYNGKHPVHLIGTNGGGGSNVYGWVDLSQIRITVAGTATQTTPTAPARADNKPATGTTYTVQSGDCLWNIAKKLSNKNGANWRELYDIPENKAVIGSNPNVIRPGQVLIIPPGWVTA